MKKHSVTLFFWALFLMCVILLTFISSNPEKFPDLSHKRTYVIENKKITDGRYFIYYRYEDKAYNSYVREVEESTYNNRFIGQRRDTYKETDKGETVFAILIGGIILSVLVGFIRLD